MPIAPGGRSAQWLWGPIIAFSVVPTTAPLLGCLGAQLLGRALVAGWAMTSYRLLLTTSAALGGVSPFTPKRTQSSTSQPSSGGEQLCTYPTHRALIALAYFGVAGLSGLCFRPGSCALSDWRYREDWPECFPPRWYNITPDGEYIEIFAEDMPGELRPISCGPDGKWCRNGPVYWEHYYAAVQRRRFTEEQAERREVV